VRNLPLKENANSYDKKINNKEEHRMAVRIRLQRRGAHKRPYYHIVVADHRAPRDGKFIQKIGTYNPLKEPAEITLRSDIYQDWIRKGARPSEAVADLVRQHRKGSVGAENVS